MHWQYLSICRGGKSIMEKISEAGINPENYISFFALRGHGKIHHNHSGENSDKKSSNSTDCDDDGISGSQSVNNGSKESIIKSKSLEVSQGHCTEDSFSDERPQHSSNERIGGEPVIPDSIKQTDPKHIFVTEEIYIHSKLMIVDDRFVICGSGKLRLKHALRSSL
jgi:phospholipase D1/2